jgi:hypothetical protein
LLSAAGLSRLKTMNAGESGEHDEHDEHDEHGEHDKHSEGDEVNATIIEHVVEAERVLVSGETTAQ